MSQDGLRPVDKPVQTAGGTNNFDARSDGKMISIAEDDLRADFAQLARVKCLDAPLCPHGHEDRRVNDAVSGGQAAQARFGSGVRLQQCKHCAPWFKRV